MILAGAGLVFCRVGALFLALPVVASHGVPKAVPVLLALCTTAIVVPNAPAFATEGALPLLLAGEIFLGASIGLFVRAVFSSLTLCGELMSMQMGLSMARLFDPVQKVSEGPVALLASLLATLVFLSLDLHVTVLVLLVDGFRAVPPGTVDPFALRADRFIEAGGQVFRTGLQLSGPVLVLVMLINVLVGVLGKLAPRMNVFFSVGPTLTTVGGIALLAFALPSLLSAHAALMREAVTAAFSLWPG